MSLTDKLTELLWPEGDGLDKPQVYAIVDAARDPVIEPMVRTSRLEYACLFQGELSRALRAAAPYVVHLAAEAQLTPQLLRRGWGRAWGFFTVVPPDVTLTQHRRHLRTLLRVNDESGRKLLFRYYDPRVLRVYLPTCTQEELNLVFGPIPRIVVESGDGDSAVSYRRGVTRLEIEPHPLGLATA